jgi:arylsulfatase A-like enzyme
MRQTPQAFILVAFALLGCESDGEAPPARSFSLLGEPAIHLSLAGGDAAPFTGPGAEPAKDLMERIRCVGALVETGRDAELVATMTAQRGGHLTIDVPAPTADGRRGFLELEYLGASGGILRLGGRNAADDPLPSAVSVRVRAGQWEQLRFTLDDPRLPVAQPTRLCVLPPTAEIGEIRIRATRWIEPGAIHRSSIELQDQRRAALLLAPDSAIEWEFDLPARSRVQFGYGNAATSARTGDGVYFFAELVAEDGTVRRLWSQTLLARSNPEHQRWQDVSIPIELESPRRVKLRIGALASPPRQSPFEAIHSEAGDAPALSAPRIDLVDDQRPSVLVIVVDTLRADGFSAETMPRFWSRLRDFTIFERAHATGSWTHPSTGSIWSGLMPQEHGLGSSSSGTSFFDPDVRLLPEWLRDEGYATAAVSNNLIVSPAEGFARGIDSFDARPLEDAAIHGAERVSLAGAEWLGSRRGAGPFFLYLHYFDPHDRYAPPPEYVDSFSEGIDWNAMPSGIRDGQVNGLLSQMVSDGRRTDFQPPAGQIAALWALYRAEILYADHWIDWLLERMDESGQLDNTLVVLTADHGEEFYEHGGFKHGHSLNEEVLGIPLAIRFPDGHGAGQTVSTPVSLLDLLPTILRRAGIDPGAHPGVDLHAWPGGDTSPERAVGAVLFEAPTRDHLLAHPAAQAVWRGKDKLLRVFPQSTPQLFDLSVDPRESRDLAMEETALRDELVQLMNAMLGTSAPARGDESTLDPELAEKLRALGYVD